MTPGDGETFAEKHCGNRGINIVNELQFLMFYYFFDSFLKNLKTNLRLNIYFHKLICFINYF